MIRHVSNHADPPRVTPQVRLCTGCFDKARRGDRPEALPPDVVLVTTDFERQTWLSAEEVII